MDLTGKVALVTGGYGLYGAPISEALAEAGALVVIAARSLNACEKQAEVLRSRGLQAYAMTYDQSDDASVLRLRDSISKEYGDVTILVNNSVARPMQSMHDSLESWRLSMEVNATGLFAISRAFLERMMLAGQGSIINIGSIQGVVAPDFGNYAGTDMTTPPDYQFNKHGLIGLTKYLAAWGGPYGVRVNALSPGGLETAGHPEAFITQYCRRVFLKRLARHDDIKGAVVFLASEASAYITGQNVIVDGGYCC